MRPLFALLAVAACLLPSVASAHPLGNFTVNHYTRLEPAGDRLRVVYVVDMAEIPTFQHKPGIEANPQAYAQQLGENLHLTLDGSPAALTLDQHTLSFPEGQGGLPTLRLEATYSAALPRTPGPTVRLDFRDDNDPSRIGWREIIARPGSPGTRLEQASVPSEDVTHELRQYPDDLLSSPLSVREAHLAFVPGAAADAPVLASPTGVLDRARGPLADLARGADELTPAFLLFAVGLAIVLGAAHALQPGHGKTIVAAYLVGSRGTPRHALFLGATVTATHTAGVYALGLTTLFLSPYVVPERLYPILEIVSGALVLGIGAWLLGKRLLALRPHPAGLRHSLKAPQGHGDGRNHEHEHGHQHQHGGGHHELTHDHGHGHQPEPGHHHGHDHAPPTSWRGLLALGVSGGLLPCPEALLVLLITIAAHQVLFGLLLIVAFSAGLAGVLVSFGLVLVYARGLFSRLDFNAGLAQRVLPVGSALVIVVAGTLITANALPQVV
jgi:nickel/cobalt transporter (NicO) family protein